MVARRETQKRKPSPSNTKDKESVKNEDERTLEKRCSTLFSFLPPQKAKQASMRVVGEEPCGKLKNQAHRAALATKYVPPLWHSQSITNPPAPLSSLPAPSMVRISILCVYIRLKMLVLEQLPARLSSHGQAALRIDIRRGR